MTLGFNYGPKASLQEIFEALMPRENSPPPVVPVWDDGDLVVFHFPDGEIDNWHVIQAVPGEKPYYLYRRFMIDHRVPYLKGGGFLEPVITIDVMPTSNFTVIVGELENWFTSELPAGVEPELWAETEKRLYQFELAVLERTGAQTIDA